MRRTSIRKIMDITLGSIKRYLSQSISIKISLRIKINHNCPIQKETSPLKIQIKLRQPINSPKVCIKQ